MSGIPVYVLTGFLGAGKTTLLNKALARPALANTAVIVNEFGDVGIDHLLVEQGGDGIMELSGGCLCCAVRGELAETLARLGERATRSGGNPIERIIIETTGLADPVPVLEAIGSSGAAFTQGSVVTAVDAVNGAETIAKHGEAALQTALSDLIVVTKADLGGGADDLAAELARRNAHAGILFSNMAGFEAASLFTGISIPRARSGKTGRALVGGHDHAGPHGHTGHTHAQSVSIVHDGPMKRDAVEMFCDLLLSTTGATILRLKGIVEIKENPDRPLVVQAAGRILHPPELLPAWPDRVRGTRMVVIGTEIDEDHVRRLFSALAGQVSADTPDRVAVTDNPLAIPGIKL